MVEVEQNNNKEEPVGDGVGAAKKADEVKLSDGGGDDIPEISPEQKQTIEEAKRIIWKLAPEFVFMSTSFSSTLIATFYILMGASMIAWYNSISSILVDSSDPVVDHAKTKDEVRIVQESVIANKFDMRKSGFMSTPGIGGFMIVTAILALINTIVSWRATILALRLQLLTHRWFDIPMLVSGGLAMIWIFGITNCLDENDIFERSLLDSFMNFGDFGRADAVINGIQESLGCCGVHGPMDYIDSEIRLVTMSTNLRHPDGVQMVFPTSCCREWWVRNVHCASTVHKYLTAPMNLHNLMKFTETIHTVGCVERAFDVCNRFVWTFKIGIPMCTIFYFIHMVIKYFAVIQMLRESKIQVKLTQEKQKHGRLDLIEDEDDDSEESSAINKEVSRRKKLDLMSATSVKSRRTRPMTQDERQFHKERAQFVQFENILAKSYFRKFIEQARDTTEYATERNAPKEEHHVKKKVHHHHSHSEYRSPYTHIVKTRTEEERHQLIEAKERREREEREAMERSQEVLVRRREAQQRLHQEIVERQRRQKELKKEKAKREKAKREKAKKKQEEEEEGEEPNTSSKHPYRFLVRDRGRYNPSESAKRAREKAKKTAKKRPDKKRDYQSGDELSPEEGEHEKGAGRKDKSEDEPSRKRSKHRRDYSSGDKVSRAEKRRRHRKGKGRLDDSGAADDELSADDRKTRRRLRKKAEKKVKPRKKKKFVSKVKKFSQRYAIRRKTYAKDPSRVPGWLWNDPRHSV